MRSVYGLVDPALSRAGTPEKVILDVGTKDGPVDLKPVSIIAFMLDSRYLNTFLHLAIINRVEDLVEGVVEG